MQAIKVILGLFGLALVVGGVMLIAESGTGGDFRFPFGVILAIAGLPLIFFSLISWLKSENKSGHVEDMRQYDILQGLAQLNILRKLLVLLSMPILMIGGLFIFVGLVSDKGLVFGLIAFGVGVALFHSAWPTALQNFRNTSLKGFASLALLIVVAFAGLGVAGYIYKADQAEWAETMRTMPMEETSHLTAEKKLQVEKYRGELAQKNGGVFVTYHWHGPKRLELNYADGELNGPIIKWHRDGQKKLEAGYVDGELNGPSIEWYQFGQKKLEEGYVNGELNGPRISWYSNGQKQTEAGYINGEKDGLETLWFKGGVVSRRKGWANGRLQGPYITWHENGQKGFEQNFVNGIAQGPGRKWDEEGNELPPT